MFPSIYLWSPPRSKLLATYCLKIAFGDSWKCCNDEVLVCRRIRRRNIAEYRNVEDRAISCSVKHDEF
jgi:hypothetical protein